jgi:hypothetical protein
LSQRVESSGDEGWVMRILAMLICRCLDHFVEMIEDLLAKIRAGTIVLPDWAYEQSANSANGETGKRQAAATRARVSASSRPCAAQHGALANDPRNGPACAHQRSVAAVQRRPRLTFSARGLAARRCDPAPSRLAWHPPRVPRWPAEKFTCRAPRPRMSISLRYRIE